MLATKATAPFGGMNKLHNSKIAEKRGSQRGVCYLVVSCIFDIEQKPSEGSCVCKKVKKQKTITTTRDVNVQYNGGLLPDIILLLTQC